MLFELELNAVLARQVPQLRPITKYQAVQRDLAIVVAEQVTHAQVQEAIAAAVAPSTLRAAVLFDVYRPKPLRAGEVAGAGALQPGEKSLAVRLTLASDTASLTEAEIDAAVQAVVTQLVERTGAKLRA